VSAVVDLHAEARPVDRAAGDELVGDPTGEVDRDREAETDASAAAARERRAGGVDADETRLAVDERAAAVARIDRRVRLNRALLASMVTTDGSARSATVAAGQAAAAPFEIGAVSAVELPFPGLQVSQTISPPATQPTIAASRNPSSSRTVVGRAEPTAPRLFSPQSRSDPPPSAPLRSGHPVAAALETSRAALPRAAPCPVLRVIRA
jgi:hypothetical protein